MPEGEIQLRGLAARAYREFNDAADFVWKTPEFIEEQTRLELQKLRDYFPMTGDKDEDARRLEMRDYRWTHEERKLKRTFPYLLASGNLFTAISLFETYCLMLCKELEQATGIMIAGVTGNGLGRLREHMSLAGINSDLAPFKSEVSAAIRIRNCLFHASGILGWSREEAELRRIVSSASFLSPEHRSHRRNLEESADEVAIVSGPLGDRIQINNMYSFLVLYYLRDNFVGLYQSSLLSNDDA